TRRYIARIIPFGLLWMLFSVVYLLLEKGILGDSPTYPSTGNPYDFQSSFVPAVLFATLAVLLVGTFEILYLNKVYEKYSFGKKLLYKTGFYFLILAAFLFINAIGGNSIKMGTPLSDPEVREIGLVFFAGFALW